MPAGYDYLNYRPVAPFPWSIYCDWAGNREVFDPSAGWIPIGSIALEGMGFMPTSGGVMTAPLTGAHGSAPDQAANILESLRLEGIDVVTVADLDAWRARIVQEVKVTQELSKTTETPGNTVNILSMQAFSRKTFRLRSGTSYDFADASIIDIRPKFTDGSFAEFEYSYFIAVVSGVCGVTTAPGNMTEIVGSSGLDGNLNLGFPSGWWIEWLANSPPKIKANSRHQPGDFDLIITIYGFGRR